MNPFFSKLASDWCSRSARATISQIGPCNPALRQHLYDVLDLPAGSPGAFVNEPSIEALFEWEKCGTPLEDIDLLSSQLVDAMDAPLAPFESVRFDRKWQPYSHQQEAWTKLLSKEARSVVVSTGTASGKTECFLVPILESLVRESKGRRLEGVRALFLYPLNALINSQRERLAGWTSSFGETIRFGLFNGATPNRVKAEVRKKSPFEAKDRDQIRSSAPPILVTNATMLEYMLVRSEDRPIIEQSKGKLRWIVLDEAHTYVGAAAAEISLLLRRVMHAFEVHSEDVRFVATSATIGGDHVEDLRSYLADLAGIPRDRVDVVLGSRVAPDLPGDCTSTDSPLPTIDELEAMDGDSAYKALASNGKFREARAALTANPMLSSQFVDAVGIDAGRIWTGGDSCRLLDVCSSATRDDEILLPVRAHFFHRSQPGLWACSDPRCSEVEGTALANKHWKFGMVYLERRGTCACGGMVLDIVVCNSCGAEHLTAIEESRDGDEYLVPAEWDMSRGDFDAEEDPDAEERGGAVPEARVLLVGQEGGPNVSDPVPFTPSSGRIGDGPVHVRQLMIDQQAKAWRCARCRALHGARDVLRPIRLGRNFFAKVAVPALLEELPEEAGASAMPMHGRRMITFSDSRQGTARFAAQTQLEAERNYVRSQIYHSLWAGHVPTTGIDKANLESDVAALREAARTMPALESVLRTKEAELEALEAGTVTPQMSWAEMQSKLSASKGIRWVSEDQKARYLPSDLSPNQWSSLVLYREFLRRPARQNSLETMGLVQVAYRRIDKVRDIPGCASILGMSLPEWREFLCLCLDHVIRARTTTQIHSSEIRWMGTSFSQRRVVDPGHIENDRVKYAWPTYRRGRMPRLGNMLALGLGLDPARDEDVQKVDAVLHAAWSALKDRELGLLVPDEDGLYLEYPNQIDFRGLREGFVCPLTKRVLDRTFRGITPYASPGTPIELARAVRIALPELTAPFKPDSTWFEFSEEVLEARRLGVWNEYTDRVARGAEYISVGEHSAQMPRSRLNGLEKQFKEGRVNVLSCSTTMEMGVDIGGLVGVGMNNTPPGPANFLQRAGRAGRRGQPRAVSLTMCESTPHGEAVFQHPDWPFTTPIHVPRVSLDSERIVRRHVQSLLLSRFLIENVNEALRLTAQAFFRLPNAGGPSLATVFSEWLRGKALFVDGLGEGIISILERTVLQSCDPESLVTDAADSIDAVRDAWTQEDEVIAEDLASVGGEPLNGENATPAQSAILSQRKRFWGEYLLALLCSEGFLPSHGFPLHVVQFVSTTAELLSAEEKARKENDPVLRDLVPGSRREYPSRHLASALREYAPGSMLVLDRVAFRSEGVLLNWHLPTTDHELREVQALGWAWHCKSCGDRGIGRDRFSTCPTCQDDRLRSTRFLKPNGFAVDIRARPDGNVDQQFMTRVDPPWVSARGAHWLSLPDPRAGRLRHAPQGTIFYNAKGEQGLGYVLCLECGRAVSMERGHDGKPAVPALMAKSHTRLRRGSKAKGNHVCGSTAGDWKVLTNSWLGGVEATDVLEIQLSGPRSGQQLRDDKVAISLAVAMRQALAQRLGVDAREIGWSIDTLSSTAGRSIFLYDTTSGGAGYVASALMDIVSLFSDAEKRLQCARDCDRACHACLLTHDTREVDGQLDRRKALKWLDGEGFMDGFTLQSEQMAFGESTGFESVSLDRAVIDEARRPGCKLLRLHFRASQEGWDVWSLPMVREIAGLQHIGVDLELVVTKKELDGMSWQDSYALSSLAEASSASVVVGEDSPLRGCMFLAAEIQSGSGWKGWATSTEEDLTCSSAWGRAEAVRVHGALEQEGNEIRPASAFGFPKEPPIGWQHVHVAQQLDGPLLGAATRFVQFLLASDQSLREKLAGTRDLVQVNYTDRYVRSPGVAFIVASVIRKLAEAGASEISEVQVVLNSTYGRRDRPSNWMTDDWPNREAQTSTLEQLLDGLSATVSITEGLHNCDHQRSLELAWRDGSSATIVLDQGFGFLKIRSQERYPFNASAREQVRKLSSQRSMVGNEGRPSSMFIKFES